HCFVVITPPPPTPTLFPYTTLFRSETGRPEPFEAASITVPEPDLCFDTHLTGTSTPPPGLAATLDSAHHISDDPHAVGVKDFFRSEEHTSELQSRFDLVCRLLLEKK